MNNPNDPTEYWTAPKSSFIVLFTLFFLCGFAAGSIVTVILMVNAV